MRPPPRPLLALAACAVALSGCSSLDADRDRGPDATVAVTAGDATGDPVGDTGAAEAAASEAAAEAAASEAAAEAAASEAAAAAEREAAEREAAEREAARRAAERRAEEERIRREQTTTVQEVLAANGYYAGPIDGEAGPMTQSAVMAFQKVQGISRDGAIGPETMAALEQVRQPPLAGGAGTRIEIDLDRQVVHLVRDGQRLRTMNASSGNGEVYTWPDGRVARADTPVGTFTIQRRIEGLRDGDLGAMYDPLYFHEGWALHGSNSVPAHPASHGCVRLSRADATWVADQVPNGTQVVIHGSVNAFDPDTETVWL